LSCKSNSETPNINASSKDVLLYINQIYDYQKCKLVNPNLAKAMLKNDKFQSLAGANDKVMFAILSQDFELIKNALKDPRVNLRW
jgi:hypothetical protein